MRTASLRVLLGLFLTECAIAVRFTDEATGEEIEQEQGGMDMEAMSSKLLKDLRKQQKHYEQGKKLEEKMSCEQVQERLLVAMNRSSKDLHDFESLNVDETVATQQMVSALVTVADKKRCLPEVLGAPEAQTQLAAMLSAVPKLLGAPKVGEGRYRFQLAYLQLVEFQNGILSLGKDLIDRGLVLPTDIQTSCPKPCQKCDDKGVAGFSFRCLLRRADRDRVPELPERHGVTCSAPKFRWLRWYPYKKVCKVADWRKAALQQLHVVAILSCATTTVIQGLHNERTVDQRRQAHRLCIKRELGIVALEEDGVRPKVDDAISPKLKLVFGHVVGLGMASGLAGLRQATRGVGSHAATAFQAAFEKHLPDGLEQRPSDVAIYASKDLLDEHKTMPTLDACEGAYGFEVQHTFAGGTKSLTLMAFAARDVMEKADDGEDGGGDDDDDDEGDTDWGEVTFYIGTLLAISVVAAYLTYVTLGILTLTVAGWNVAPLILGVLYMSLVGHVVSFFAALLCVFFGIPGACTMHGWSSSGQGVSECLHQLRVDSPASFLELER